MHLRRVSASHLRAGHTPDHYVSDYNHSWWAYYVLRPVAFQLAPWFLRLGFSAMAVTGVALLLLCSGLIVMAFGSSTSWLLAGVVLVNGFYFLDFVDGVVARQLKTVSRTGEIFDFLSGLVFHVGTPLAIAAVLHRSDVPLNVPLVSLELAGSGAWWIVGLVMSGAFLLRRVVSQKLDLTFGAKGRKRARLPPWQVALRTVEAVKIPILLLALLPGFLSIWLLFYSVYGMSTALGAMGLALARARRWDRSQASA